MVPAEARASGELRAPWFSRYGLTRGQPRRRCWGHMGGGPCLSVPGEAPAVRAGTAASWGRERQDSPAARGQQGAGKEQPGWERRSPGGWGRHCLKVEVTEEE